jgi:hypothetical protein
MMRALICLLSLLCGIASAQPLAGAGQVLPDLKPLGKGEMRWFGFKLYDASLWASGGSYSPDGGFALSIRYARSFDGERLAGASIDEIKRLGQRDKSKLARWKDTLTRVFPDVKEGDVITGVKMLDGSARFFHQGAELPAIEDKELSDAFFAIWLDARTREPGLRARLLAETAPSS